jgi:hypothetical protein
MVRRILVVLIAGFVGASFLAAHASSRPVDVASHPRVETNLGLAPSIWSWLRGFWPEEGCRLEPNGGCAPALVPQGARTGTGGALPATKGALAKPRRTDGPRPLYGCSLEPNGQCV